MAAHRSGLRAATTAALVASAAGCGGDAKPFRGPQLESISRVVDVHYPAQAIELDNGVVAYLLPESGSPLVRIDARYRVGADADPVPGMAHLVEHASYGKRATPGGPSLADRLATTAVSYNALTSWEATHYISVGPPSAVEALLAIEADRLAGCEGIDAAALANERDVVRSEIRRRDVAAFAPIRAAIYPAGHRRRASLSGSEKDVARIDRAKMCEFVEAHYRPSRLLLVISGGFELPVVESILRARFAATEPATAPVPVRPPAISSVTAKVRVAAPIVRPALLLAFPATPPGDPSFAVSELNARAMAASAARLEDDHRWIKALAVYPFDSGSRPMWLVLIEVDDAARLTRARELFFERRGRYLADIAREGERFESAVLVLDNLLHERRRQLIQSVATIDGRAFELAERLQLAGHPHGVTPELRKLSALTRAQVIDNAEHVLDPATARVIEVVPSSEGARSPALGAISGGLDLDPVDLAVDAASASRPLAGVAIGAPQILERSLDNGVRVLVAPGMRAPLVEIRVVFSHSPRRPAIARASAALIGPDFDQRYTSREQVETLWSTIKMGGSQSRSTAMGTTTFRLSGLAAFRDGLLWRLAWVVSGGVFAKKDVDEYNRDRGADDGEARVFARVMEKLYGPEHSRARPPRRVSRDQLSDFKRASYRAGGAAVVVTGQLDGAAVDRQIDRLFGAWKGGVARAAAPPPRPLSRSRSALLRWVDPSEGQPEIDIRVAVEPGDAATHAARLIAADVIEQELFAVRSELGASYSLSASYVQEVDGCWFRIHGDLAVERADKAARRLVELIGGVAEDGPARRAQFVRARRRVVLDLIDEMSHPAGLARQLEYVAENGAGAGYFVDVARAAAALTIDRWSPEIDLRRAVVVVRGPALGVERIGAAFGPVDAEPVGE